MLEGFIESREGSARILVPDPKRILRSNGKIEPSWAPVFYNPEMTDNRSLTIELCRIYSKLKNRVLKGFAEPLAGLCVRSIRVLVEAGACVEKAYACDINPLAVKVCLENKKLNSLENLRVFLSDANKFMYELDYNGVPIDVVDIDPFGSPIYYVQSSVKSLASEGLLIATATDLGALEGKYPEVCFRRYGARVFRTWFSKEVAARVLLASIARIAFMLDRSVKPVFTVYDKHYVKIAVEVEHRKTSASEKARECIGYIIVSREGVPKGFTSMWNLDSKILSDSDKLVGPLWICELWSRDYVSLVDKSFFSKKFSRLLERIESECLVETPYYYRIDKIASKISYRVPRINELVEKLREEGFKASRTHFDPMSIRTNASYQELLEVISRILR